MSKLLIVLFAVLLVSVACDRKAEREAQKKLEGARAACVASINQASRAISQKYHATVEQLPTLEQRDIMFEIVKDATNKLNALIPVARSASTLEVAYDVETAFGGVVNCYPDLAVSVSEITYEAYNDLNALVENSQ